MEFVEWLDTKASGDVTQSLLGKHPNSYTFSKFLAEDVVSQYANILPVSIVRPSIVVPSLKEPVSGWVDTLNGPVGVLVGGAKGVIWSMLCSKENQAQVVPVDVLVNALIVISWKKGSEREDEKLPVYNVSCGEVVKVSWGKVLEKGKEVAYKYPIDPGLWYPSGNITTNHMKHFITVFLLQLIPAYIIDFLLTLLGVNAFMIRIQKRIKIGMELLQYFTIRKWDVNTSKTLALSDCLSKTEQEIFYILNVNFDLDDYMVKAILGTKQFCLKEPLSDLPEARRKLLMFYILDITVKCFFLFVILLIVYQFSSLYIKSDIKKNKNSN